MAYEVVMPYHLHMPSYFLETFTEYPWNTLCLMSGWQVLAHLPTFLLRKRVCGVFFYVFMVLWGFMD